jgi:ketosteroid isomerase-like protein
MPARSEATESLLHSDIWATTTTPRRRENARANRALPFWNAVRSGMSAHDNIARVRQFYAAGPPDDDRERAQFASPDIVWHVPGDNPVSGEYRGHRAVFAELGDRMQPLAEWDVQVVDVMANADLVVATVRVVAARGTQRVETNGAHVFRFDDQGRIVEAWGFTVDQAGLDSVFRA